MKYLPLIGALLLASCLRGPSAPPTPLEEDKSIVFPNFFGVEGTAVGDPGKLYEVDGVTLRALMIAISDFLPSSDEEKPCWSAPQGHRYRIVRQGNIIFIQIYADTDNCKRGFSMMDYGVKYAISTDGRILRRIFAGDPDDPSLLKLSDAGVVEIPQDKDLSDMLGATSGSSDIAIPLSWLDGGVPGQSPVVPSPPTPDGGPGPDGGFPSDGGSSTPLAP